MSNEEIIIKLNSNPKDISEELIRLLIKICDNIIKDPSNLKIRTLQKNNPTISRKIIAVNGGIECIKLMGFEETVSSFTLPMHVSLKNLERVKHEILIVKDKIPNNKGALPKAEVKKSETPRKEENSTKPMIQKTVLPPLVLIFTNPFLRRVETLFHNALTYEDKNVQKRALSLVPLTEIQTAAQIQLRNIQEKIKKEKLPDPDISIQDALIIELLDWFKNEFFEWVDSPDCQKCGGKTKMSHMSTDPSQLVYTDRVELHRCETCNEFTPFARYNDLNILLETRKGRCGEWANTFTLFCRAMGWDARFVVDEGDHVWTEVYSITQKRWLHCDPCENICDTPLIYETGWGKKLTYVMAYSAEEVQDVTWRYSANHKAVLERRKNCTEEELVQALMTLRRNRQKMLAETRTKYLTRRLLNELLELMVEKKPNETDNQGRISGSMAWRLGRGETQGANEDVRHIWRIADDDIIDNTINLTYTTSSNLYRLESGNKDISQVKSWHAGAFLSKAIFRKEEKDWKVVYLARTEGSSEGEIVWRIEVDSSKKEINTISLCLNHKTFENGDVRITLNSENKMELLPKNEKSIVTNVFSGAKSVTISALLSGGKGNVAWQHAQLFRQNMDDLNHQFLLTITFKDK